MRSSYAEVTAYVTKDVSTIRELMHPAGHGNRQQSLAKAVVAPGRERRYTGIDSARRFTTSMQAAG